MDYFIDEEVNAKRECINLKFVKLHTIIGSKEDEKLGVCIADYIFNLISLAQTCDFNDYLNEALRDTFVFGVREEKEKGLNFTKAVVIAQKWEMAESEKQTSQ